MTAVDASNQLGISVYLDFTQDKSTQKIASRCFNRQVNWLAFFSSTTYLKSSNMKTKSLLLLALIGSLSAGVFAQTTPVDQVKQDNAQIRSDNREIGRDNRDIRRDNTQIGQDKQTLNQDQRQINADRAVRNADQRQEDRDVKNGNFVDAQKMDAARRDEDKKINGDKVTERKDRRALALDRNDRNQDIKARNDERRERNHVVAKRNKDASHIR